MNSQTLNQFINMPVKDKNTTEHVLVKEEYNAGRAAFNHCVEKEPHYDEATKISNEEKTTGHIPGFGRENNDAKDGNTKTKKLGADK